MPYFINDTHSFKITQRCFSKSSATTSTSSTMTVARAFTRLSVLTTPLSPSIIMVISKPI